MFVSVKENGVGLDPATTHRGHRHHVDPGPHRRGRRAGRARRNGGAAVGPHVQQQREGRGRPTTTRSGGPACARSWATTSTSSPRPPPPPRPSRRVRLARSPTSSSPTSTCPTAAASPWPRPAPAPVPVVMLTVSEAERDLARRRGRRRRRLPRQDHPDRGAASLALEGRPRRAGVLAPAGRASVLGEFRRLSKQATGANPLSDREREVLQYVARGHSYREIGEQLFIAEKTVENHVRNILGKLHLSRRKSSSATPWSTGEWTGCGHPGPLAAARRTARPALAAGRPRWSSAATQPSRQVARSGSDAPSRTDSVGAARERRPCCWRRSAWPTVGWRGGTSRWAAAATSRPPRVVGAVDAPGRPAVRHVPADAGAAGRLTVPSGRTSQMSRSSGSVGPSPSRRTATKVRSPSTPSTSMVSG